MPASTSSTTPGSTTRARAKSGWARRLQGKRDRVVLMTKVCTHGRDKNVAMRMLEESLRRLQTDHLDVWQIHEVIYDNDPDLIFAPNGAAEALVQAKKQGKVRLRRIHRPQGSVHPPEDAVARLSLRHRTDAAELLRRDVPQLRDSRCCRKLNRRGIAPLGMKSMGGSGEMVRAGRGHACGGAALRDEPAGGGDHQRHGIAGGAAAEPGRSRADSSR